MPRPPALTICRKHLIGGRRNSSSSISSCFSQRSVINLNPPLAGNKSFWVPVGRPDREREGQVRPLRSIY